jgi:hypothetical protein
MGLEVRRRSTESEDTVTPLVFRVTPVIGPKKRDGVGAIPFFGIHSG